ncbi:MAG: hypothetical protein IT209_04580 [Armatimonadetes bacterium]|nr:hypothetical protein [Armatimonadota bacterium]
MESLQAWLNDKKNMPIILGGFVGILVLVGVLYFFVFSGGGGGGEEVQAPPVTPGAPGEIPGQPPMATPAPGASPAPGGSPEAQTGAQPVQTASAAGTEKAEPPLEMYRPDPFRPVFGQKPKRAKVAFASRFQPPDIRKLKPVVVGQTEIEDTLPPQPQRRMAGLLKNDRVFAIIETEGRRSEIVAPGQQLDENLVVDRILPDRVILRSTRTRTPQYVEVPKSAGQPQPRNPAATAPAPRPGRGGPVPMPPAPRGIRGRGPEVPAP